MAEGLSQAEGRSGSGFVGVEGIEMVLGSESEKRRLDGGDAIEAPGAVAERLDELFFECAFGLKLIDEALEVVLVGG